MLPINFSFLCIFFESDFLEKSLFKQLIICFLVFTLYENTKDKDGTEYNLKTGHYYYTDVTKAHAVRNTSDVDRIHLVADCYSNEKMRALLN